jgi:hypothetical protein
VPLVPSRTVTVRPPSRIPTLEMNGEYTPTAVSE